MVRENAEEMIFKEDAMDIGTKHEDLIAMSESKPSGKPQNRRGRRSSHTETGKRKEKKGRKDDHTAKRRARMEERNFKDWEITIQMLGIDGEPGSRLTQSPHAPLVDAEELTTRVSSLGLAKPVRSSSARQGTFAYTSSLHQALSQRPSDEQSGGKISLEQTKRSRDQWHHAIDSVLQGDPEENRESAFLVATGKAQDLKQSLEVLPASCEDSWIARRERLTILENAIGDLAKIKEGLEHHCIYLTSNDNASRYAEILQEVIVEIQNLALSCSEALQEGLHKLKDRPTSVTEAFKLPRRFLQILKSMFDKKGQMIYATKEDLKRFRSALGSMCANVIIAMTDALTDIQEVHFQPVSFRLQYGANGSAHEIQDRCRLLTSGWIECSEMTPKVSKWWPAQANRIAKARSHMLVAAAKAATKMQQDLPVAKDKSGLNERIKYSPVGACSPTSGVWGQNCGISGKTGPTVTDDDMQAQGWLAPLAFTLLKEANKAGIALFELAEQSPSDRVQYEEMMDEMSEALYGLALVSNSRLGSMVVDSTELARWALQSLEDQTSQAVLFVMELDRGILGGGHVALTHHEALRDATKGVINTHLHIRRLLRIKGGPENPRPLPVVRTDSHTNLAGNANTAKPSSGPQAPKSSQSSRLGGHVPPIATGREARAEASKRSSKSIKMASKSSKKQQAHGLSAALELPELGQSPTGASSCKASSDTGNKTGGAKIDLGRPSRTDGEEAIQSSAPLSGPASDRSPSPAPRPHTPEKDDGPHKVARVYTASSNFDNIPSSGSPGLDPEAAVQQQLPKPEPEPGPGPGLGALATNKEQECWKQNKPLLVFGSTLAENQRSTMPDPQGGSANPVRFWGTMAASDIARGRCPETPVRHHPHSPFANNIGLSSHKWSTNRLNEANKAQNLKKAPSPENQRDLDVSNGVHTAKALQNGHSSVLPPIPSGISEKRKSEDRGNGQASKERKSSLTKQLNGSKPAQRPSIELLNGNPLTETDRLQRIAGSRLVARVNLDRRQLAFRGPRSDPTEGFFFSQATAAMHLAKVPSTPVLSGSSSESDSADEEFVEEEPLALDEPLQARKARTLQAYKEFMTWRAADPLRIVKWPEVNFGVYKILEGPGGGSKKPARRWLGEGSFGAVFEGWVFGSQMAIKTFTVKSEAKLPETLSLFMREVDLQKALGGFPYIVSMPGICCDFPSPEEKDFDFSQIQLAIIMELCHHGSLHSVIKLAGRIAREVPREVSLGDQDPKSDSLAAMLMRTKGLRLFKMWAIRLEMMKQVASAIQFMHSKEVAHRDLTSMNILVTDRYEAKVSDFGLSKSLRETNTFTVNFVNSVCWAAPEKLSGSGKAYDPKAADVFSFGVIMWELITLKAPWAHVEEQEDPDIAVPAGHVFRRPDRNAYVLEHVPKGERLEFPDPEEILPPLPEVAELIKLAKRCWAQDPKERPLISEVNSILSAMYPGVKARSMAEAKRAREARHRLLMSG